MAFVDFFKLFTPLPVLRATSSCLLCPAVMNKITDYTRATVSDNPSYQFTQDVSGKSLIRSVLAMFRTSEALISSLIYFLDV